MIGTTPVIRGCVVVRSWAHAAPPPAFEPDGEAPPAQGELFA